MNKEEVISWMDHVHECIEQNVTSIEIIPEYKDKLLR